MPEDKKSKFLEVSSHHRINHVEFVSADWRNSAVPYCEHGPCILFERCKNGSLEKFFACAVCRSRKECNFYASFDDMPAKPERIRLALRLMKEKRRFSHKKLYARLKKYRKIQPEKRQFCVDCSTVLSDENDRKAHSNDERKHSIIRGVLNKQLREPSRFLSALTNEKKEAQYMFSSDFVTFFGESIVSKFNFDGVLAVGAPRVHEFLRRRLPYKKNCKSFLLDIDYRHAQFWSPRFYAQFNMFNGYFYTKLGEKCYGNFIADSNVKKLLIVADPPFGGMVAPLAQTLQNLKADFEKSGRGKEAHIFWVFPYFMEQKIISNIPGISMLDYKVHYDNHPLMDFKKEQSKSPIRIFTTLPPSEIQLPQAFGYRLCKKCKRYVAQENMHCDLCKTCPSKDGRPYRHCKRCSKCVKASYQHCENCKRCHKLEDTSACGQSEALCQLCEKSGHVWINCGLRQKDEAADETVQNSKATKKGGLKRAVAALKTDDTKAKRKRVT